MDIDRSGEGRSCVAKTDRTDHIVTRHRSMEGIEGVSNSYSYLQCVAKYSKAIGRYRGDQHRTPYRSNYDHGGAAGNE